MTPPRILVAGVGNIFLGDDAFGVEVARRLSKRTLPENVKVVEFGIRGLDLAYELLEDYHIAVLVDTVSRGGPPGTLYLLEPAWDEVSAQPAEWSSHSLEPAEMLRLVCTIGRRPARLLLIGCEPQTFALPEGEKLLSEAVEAAVEEAIAMIGSVITDTASQQHAGRERATP